MYAFIPRSRPVARISQGGGVLFGGKVDLKPKGGGVSFGKNVAKGWNKILGMGNWGGGGGSSDPSPLATGLAWGSGDACDHRHSILLHETCEKKKEPTNMGP